ATASGSAIHGDELADRVAVADHQLAALAAELLVLRFAADRGEREDPVLAADAGRPLDHHVGADRGAVADLDVATAHGVRPDAVVGAGGCGRVDDGGCVDHPAGTSAHRMSASATTLPSTTARPWN